MREAWAKPSQTSGISSQPHPVSLTYLLKRLFPGTKPFFPGQICREERMAMEGASPQLAWLVSGLSGSVREKAKKLKDSVTRLVRLKRGEETGCGCGFHGQPWELNSRPEHSPSIRTQNQHPHACTSLRKW